MVSNLLWQCFPVARVWDPDCAALRCARLGLGGLELLLLLLGRVRRRGELLLRGLELLAELLLRARPPAVFGTSWCI